MTIEECIQLAENHAGQTWRRGGAPKYYRQYSVEEYDAALAVKAVALPENWRRLLPSFLFGIGCTFNREWECNLHSPEIIAKIYPPTQLLVEGSSAPAPSSHCWLEFGSTFDGDFYALDLSSPSMPRDARVLLWDHETARPIKTWDSVVSFIAEMLGPVEV